ncbi:MAG: fused MFS/spermidine synthase [Thermoanaerobaculia bacterium]|nr:fused MFS/spermidine synthase [Thermoanaerobaculia bacterium]
MHRDRSFALLLLCFLLSGMAALVYETVWTEQFALVFGTSELAVATVLGAYMAGLAVGAATARRWIHRIRRPVWVYAVLELGIVLSTVAVPSGLRLAGSLQNVLLGGLDLPPDAGSLSSASFYLVVAFAVLLIPTALMGATLPLLARHCVRRDSEVGPKVGWLYAANTVGAAAGTLLAAFVILPRVGLRNAVLIGAAIHGVVFLLAVYLARTTGGIKEDAEPIVPTSPVRTGWILPAILISGFVSFSWEVMWTRLLGHLLGGTVYAFGTMLATFLVGIGLGAAAASRFSTTVPASVRGFALAQFGIAVSSWGAFLFIDRLPGEFSALAESGASLARAGSVAAMTLLPGAFFVGATFPFAVRILARSAADAAPASARIYAWNTVGAILGAVLTGFVLLPRLGFAGNALLAIGLSLVLALVAALSARRREAALATAAAAALVAVSVWQPPTPWRVLRTAPLSGLQAEGEVAYFAVGRSATVMLVDEKGRWRLSTNGLPEAAIQRPGSRIGRFTASRWMALLPLISRPETRSMLVIGLGAGGTLDRVPETIREIHVVELEPEVVEANRRMAKNRDWDPLADPRLQVHVNDVRSALSLSDRRYDAIVSQPSHPWTSGSSHLFTSEFFSLVRERLGPRGVFVQWIGLQYVDAELLRCLVATLVDVFEYVEVFQPYPGGSLLFLSGEQPLIERDSVTRGLAKGRDAWRRMGVLSEDDIRVARMLTSDGSKEFGVGAERNTDFRNLLKIRSPKILSAPIGRGGSQRLLAELDPLLRSPESAGGIYAIRRLIRERSLERARRIAAALPDSDDREVAEALTDLASGRPRLATRALWAAVENGGGASTEAFHALLLHSRGQFADRGVPPRLQALLTTDAAASAVVEGWRQMRLQQSESIRALESELASVDPQHALFDAATALRVTWRQAVGGPELAREALELLEPVLAHGTGARGLVNRAQIAVLAGERQIALTSLIELTEILDSSRAGTSAARRALALLDTFPPAWRNGDSEWVRDLLQLRLDAS